MAKAYCHYAAIQPDKDAADELFNTVRAGLLDNDFDGVRPFLTLFEVLMETDHDYFKSQRGHQLTNLCYVIESNNGYYKLTETILEFTFKLCGRNKYVRDWF